MLTMLIISHYQSYINNRNFFSNLQVQEDGHNKIFLAVSKPKSR